MNLTLKHAADIIEQTGWAQGAPALDAAGNPVPALSTAAVYYCTLGAITKAAGGHQRSVIRALNTLRHAHSICDVVVWNDKTGRTKEEVIAALRGAA